VDAPPTPTNVARPQPPADTSMDVHVVPTLSPRNTLSNSETDDSPFSSFLSATGSSDGPEQESPSRSRIPELTLQTSVEAPAPMPVPAAVAAAAAAISASTESIGASVEVQAAAPAPEPQQVPTTPERVGDPDRHAPDTVERASSDEIERKAAEIQESVAAALAKSSTISAQLQHATSIDEVTPVARQSLRRDSVSSISSDEFHDAESGEEDER